MHTEFTKLMSAALDHEADPDELARLQAHLHECPACAAAWAQWRAFDRRLSAAPLAAPPASLAAPVLRRLAEYELRRRQKQWVGGGLLVTWLLAFGLALVGVLAVSGWVASHPQQVAGILSGFAELFTRAIWLLRLLAGFLQGVNVPLVAASLGVFASLACVLAAIWLYLFGRSRNWLRATVMVGH